jgi:hypothetical protein
MNSHLINLNRLHPMPMSDRLIARPRLLQRIAEANTQAGRIVLLCTPLGYGKSCLLSQYAHGLSSAWGWLRLSRADNQPLSLLLHLHAALQVKEHIKDACSAVRMHGSGAWCFASSRIGVPLRLRDDFGVLRVRNVMRRHYLHAVLVEHILNIGVQCREQGCA